MTTPLSKPDTGRFIPKERCGTVTRWHFGALDTAPGDVARGPESAAPIDAPEAEPGWHEGYAAGLEAGRAEAQSRVDHFIAGEGHAAAQALGGLEVAFRDELAGLRQRLASELVRMACGIARQVVGSELRQRPESILPTVEQALATVPPELTAHSLLLHPDDLVCLRPWLESHPRAQGLVLKPDARITRGGCRVEAGDVLVDATVEARWRHAMNALGLDEAPYGG